MLHIKRLEIKGIVAQNLSVSAGQCISLSGASGMGKSLFMKGLADLVPNQGDINLEGQGREVFSAPDWRKRVTYVGAKAAWWDEKVIDHFEAPEWLEEVLPLVDLSPKVMKWPVSRLSSGEAQRLCLLRALEATREGEVRYLLLDEPTSALDGGRQMQVEALLTRYLKAGQIGVLFISHDDRQVARFSDKRWQIYNRRIEVVG